MEVELISKAQQFIENNKISNSTITIDNPTKTIKITGEWNDAIITAEIREKSFKGKTNKEYNERNSNIRENKLSMYNKAIELRSQGKKQKEIAEVLGVSQATISNLLRKS